MNNIDDNKILTGKIWQQLLLFFFPILIGTFFQQLYNTVDAIIVGRYVGKVALSAVGGASAIIIQLVVGFFMGLTSGGSVLISQYYGGKQKEKLDTALHTSYAFGIVFGLFLGVLGIIIAPPILRALHTPAEVMPQAVLYVRVYFAGILFVLIYNQGSAILRALGDSKRPLYYLIVSCLVNIVLDLILVVAFHMGVLGVAIATLASQGVSAVLVTTALMFRTPGVALDFRRLSVDGATMSGILRIGIPSGIQSSMYGLSNLFIQSAVNLLGVDVMAAWTAYGKVDCLFWMISNSLTIALVTVVGQNFGAGKMDRVKRATRITFWEDCAVAVGMSALMIVFGEFFMGFFTKDASVLSYGMIMIYLIAPAYLLFVPVDVFASTLRAQGFTLVTTINSLVFICAYRVIWIFWICDGSLEQICYTYPISWALCGVADGFYYLYKKKRLHAPVTQ